MTQWKTSPDKAAALAAQWYALSGTVPRPEWLQHWTTAIMQDGSNTAWRDFTRPNGNEPPAELAARRAAPSLAVKAGITNPAQPDGKSPGQLPGTNTKSIDHTWGITIPPSVANVLKTVAEVGIGALTGGAGWAALAGGVLGNVGGGALGNAGDILRNTVKGAATGAMAGGAGAALGSSVASGAGLGATVGNVVRGAIAGPGSAMGSLGKALGVGKTVTGALPGGAPSGAPTGLSDAELRLLSNASTPYNELPALPDMSVPGTRDTPRSPAPGGMPAMDGGTPGGGLWGSGLSPSDLLKMAGDAVTRGMDYRQQQALLEQQKQQFNRTQGNLEGQQAVAVQNRLNTAPMADNAQYLLMSKLGVPPTAFKPRDYTQAGGATNLTTPATGGAADQLAANQAASAKYTPGAGGVDTSALQLLLSKLKNSAYGTPNTSPAGAG